jgi:hypothetical protein
MDFTFAIHPLATLRFPHELGETVLEHPRADAAKHVFPAMLFEDDGFDAVTMQELRKQKARWAASDDADLNPHIQTSLETQAYPTASHRTRSPGSPTAMWELLL